MEKKQYTMPSIEMYIIRRPRLLCGSGSDDIRGFGSYNMRYGGVDTSGELDPD